MFNIPIIYLVTQACNFSNFWRISDLSLSLFFDHRLEPLRIFFQKSERGGGKLARLRDVFFLRRIRFILEQILKNHKVNKCYSSDAHVSITLNKLYVREKYSRFMNWQHTIITIEMRTVFQ